MQLIPPFRARAALLARRLRADTGGLALIEFAISLPVLLTIGLMGLETAHYALANLRISQMAMLAADNAGRVRISIDESDVNDIMTGTRLMGSSLNFSANGRIIISDLEQRTNNNNTTALPTTPDNPNGYRQWVRWQRCAGALRVLSSYGGPTDAQGNPITNIDTPVRNPDNSVKPDFGAVENKSILTGMGPPGNQVQASAGTAVMFVEVVYQYQPIVPINFLGPRTIRYTSAFNVRQRTNYSLTNNGALSGAGLSDCSIYSG